MTIIKDPFEFNPEDFDLDLDEAENQLFQDFGDKYIVHALRVVSTKTMTPFDNEMVYEAMCIIVAMYMAKVKNGDINKDKVLH